MDGWIVRNFVAMADVLHKIVYLAHIHVDFLHLGMVSLCRRHIARKRKVVVGCWSRCWKKQTYLLPLPTVKEQDWAYWFGLLRIEVKQEGEER